MKLEQQKTFKYKILCEFEQLHVLCTNLSSKWGLSLHYVTELRSPSESGLVLSVTRRRLWYTLSSSSSQSTYRDASNINHTCINCLIVFHKVYFHVLSYSQL